MLSVIFFDKELEEREQKQVKDQLKTAEQEFLTWLSSTITSFALDEARRSINSISIILMQKKALPQPLLSTTQIGQVENALRLSKKFFGSKKMRNAAQGILSAYATFLREEKNAVSSENNVSEIEVQNNWIKFNFSNSNQFQCTVPAYCSIKGQELVGKNWARILVGLVEQELTKDNSNLELLYKQSLIASCKDRPFFLTKKLEGLNCSYLSNGYWLNVNYSIPCLLDQIQALCLQCGYSKNDILIYGVPKNSAPKKAATSESSKNTGNGLELEKVEVHLLSLGLAGATVQEIIDAVQPGAAVFSTRNALDSSSNVVGMPNGRYVHADAFVDLDEAKEGMRRILQTHFAQFGGYSNNKLLFGAASHELSLFLNDNNCEDMDSVYSLAQYFFAKKNTEDYFIFSSPPHF